MSLGDLAAYLNVVGGCYMETYKINRNYFSNITWHQKEEMLGGFELDNNGDIVASFTHKGYTCNDLSVDYRKDVMAISVFSGAGGLDIGTQLAGVKVLSSLDIFSDSVKTLQKNVFFEGTKHEIGDITKWNGKDYSSILKKANPSKLIVIGGPPCQPFSKAGYWVTNEKRNPEEDPRNMLISYFELLKDLKPDGFILENVESIMHPSNQGAVDSIYENMQKLGYNCSLIRTNAADYGIPQKRKRVFFLASKKKINAKLIKTNGTSNECLKDSSLLPYERVIDWIGAFDKDIYCEGEKLDTQGKWGHELTCIPFGKNYISLSARESYPEPVFVAGKRYWSSLLKLHPFLPSWTIIASPGHWEGPFHWTNRRLNVRELAAIQTFPDDYVFYGSQSSIRKQIGNAVPPLLGKKVIEELCKWI